MVIGTSRSAARAGGWPRQAAAGAFAALVLVICMACGASTAFAASSPVAFSGRYTGEASLLINNGAVTISAVHGKGTGTLVGASTVSGSGVASASAQCDPFNGTGAIKGTGAKIDLRVLNSTSKGCSSGESGPVTVSFNGTAKATGGTGKAASASGSLKFKGSLHLKGTSGAQTGTFVVTLTGKLVVGG